MQISPQNALNILNQVTSTIPMKREDHLQVIGAINVLQSLITPPPKMPERKPVDLKEPEKKPT